MHILNIPYFESPMPDFGSQQSRFTALHCQAGLVGAMGIRESRLPGGDQEQGHPDAEHAEWRADGNQVRLYRVVQKDNADFRPDGESAPTIEDRPGTLGHVARSGSGDTIRND
jgi:hypothetical protein